MANLFPLNLDYTDKDFDSIRQRIINLIRSVFPTWTDHNVASFGNFLIEIKAHIGDTLGFYQDNQALESRWSTATQRQNLIALAKLIGFEPEGASAATVDVDVKVKDTGTGGALLADFTLPAGTQLFTADVTDPIPFQTLSALTFLSAGHDPNVAQTVSVEQSESAQEIFPSTGLANQEIVLASIPYLDDSAVIVADDGTYTEVENFLSSTATDRHFTVTVNNSDRATIRFGNGVNGKIPVGNIQVDYNFGGGEDGNVDPNTVTQIPGTFVDDLGNPVTVTVTNPLKASGGDDRQTAAQIQIAAPESIRVIERAVSREDFEISARKVDGVSRALMTTSNEDVSVPENAGFLYIIPEGGGTPSTALKTEVEDRFDEDGATPATLTFTVTVLDPAYKTVNILAVVFFASGADLDSTSENYAVDSIIDDLEAFFAIDLPDGSPNPEIGFGFEFKDRLGDSDPVLALSRIQDVFNDNPNVRRLGDKSGDFTLNSVHADVDLEIREFPQLGTVTIIDGDTLQTLTS